MPELPKSAQLTILSIVSVSTHSCRDSSSWGWAYDLHASAIVEGYC